MRFQRATMSGNVWFRAWPMCRVPVTLGGGKTMLKAGRPDCGSALNAPTRSQYAYHFGSTAVWSNTFANSRMLV